MRSPPLSLLVALLLLGAIPLHAAPPSASPDSAAPLAAGASFTVTRDWRGGSLPGHAPGRSTLYCTAPDASATWRPALHSICPVRISFWIPAHLSNTRSALLEVNLAGTVRSFPLNLVDGEPRWETVGEFDFAGKGEEFIRLTKAPGARGHLRVSGLKLEILDPQDRTMVWQSLILDDLATYDASILACNAFVFDDIPAGDALAPVAARLVAEKILAPLAPRTFGPDVAFTAAELAAALDLLTGPAPAAAPSATRFTFDSALAELVRRARTSGRPLDWTAAPADATDTTAWSRALGFALAGTDPIRGPEASAALTRAQAAHLLARYQRALLHAGPPTASGAKWKLAFQDEFNAPAIDATKWAVHNNQTWGKLMSIRMTGNVVQEKGLLRLITRKEKVRDKEWTTGMIGTGKAFRQTYGYWEASMRYAPAPGLNNAFWTNPGKGPAGEPGYEIDVNEGHWPNTINASLHQHDLASLSKSWRAPVDLSKDFHTYACLWTEREIIYFWDGRKISRKPNTHATHPGPVLFSTAVFPWAGSITDALHNTSMDVDWVRVWQRTDAP
jgi:beta-glucanase (GH16 family)